MKSKKAFVLPVVLILFSIIFIILLSSYRRYLISFNMVNSKRDSLVLKLEKESLESFIKTDKFREQINTRLKDIKVFSENINLDGIFGEKFRSKFSNYSFKLKVVQSEKDNIFTNKKVVNKFKNSLIKYDVFIDILKDGKTLSEYKFIDRKNILQYLFDLQFRNFIENDKGIIFKDNFYFNLDEKDYSFLYDNIFDKNSKRYVSKDIRIFNVERNLYYIENSLFLSILRDYILTSDVEFENLDISKFDISNLDKFFAESGLVDLKKKFFVDEYLVKNSNIISVKNIKKVYNFESEELNFDLDREFTIYSNFKNNGKISVSDKVPTIKGVFVNLTDEDVPINLKGICFSSNLGFKYEFYPEVLTSLSENLNISEDYFLENIDTK